MTSLRGFVLGAAFSLFQSLAAGAAGVGETIYRSGILPDGNPLHAVREQSAPVEGAAAACINCHQRSGLGAIEGRLAIPPITGMYLFHPRTGSAEDSDLPIVDTMKAERDPYDAATLARAIRDGVGADGKLLNYLMPHYTLNDAEMAGLISYLRQLSPRKVPGVDDTLLHFATIVTPDADPTVRMGVMDVLSKFFDDKNHYTRSQGPTLRSSRRIHFKVNRHWQLHIWELTGTPETWDAQLKERLRTQPVFAVISGVGGKTWAPVHHFCEVQELPCLFPIVDAPSREGKPFDAVYFSDGVLLEARLIAQDLLAQRGKADLQRVIQVYRADDVGEQASAELTAKLEASGMRVLPRVVPTGAGKREIAAALAKIQPGDAVVMWLRPADIAALDTVPSHVTLAYISGRMGGLEAAPLAPAWRSVTYMAYPFNLPEARRVQVDYPLGWFRIRQIPVVAQQAQADAYLACTILSDTLNHMVDTFVRDYLVERTRDLLEHRVLTGYYPRLSLAPGQNLASKGGYIVHFKAATGVGLVADSDWMTP